MIIHWKGKIGYGDIVSPICYSINQTYITGKPVNLQFFWHDTSNNILNTNYKRSEYIIRLIDHELLFVDHNLNGPMLKYDHTNYDIKALNNEQKYHNVYFPGLTKNSKKDLITICSPINNKQQFKDYAPDKAWKQGIDNSVWEEVINKYDNSVHVDYDTPIDELVDILSQTMCFIGYHGSVSWMARLMECPMIILSQDASFTKWAFPWAVTGTHNINNQIDNSIRHSLLLLEQSKVERNEYIERLRRTRST